MAIYNPKDVFLQAVQKRLEDEASNEMVRKHGEMLKEKAKTINAKKKISASPLPEPEPSEEEDILRPKDHMKGTGAYLRKRDSYSKMMGLEEESGAGEPAPKAKVVADDELVQSFFAKAHGAAYDPNSRVDKAKMQKILGMVNAQPDLLSLTPGKFAIKLYTTK